MAVVVKFDTSRLQLPKKFLVQRNDCFWCRVYRVGGVRVFEMTYKYRTIEPKNYNSKYDQPRGIVVRVSDY